MRFRYVLSIMCLAGILMMSCQGKKQQLKKKIEKKETKLYSDTAQQNFNIDRAHTTAKLYRQYAREFPQDSIAPKYLFKAVELYKFIGKYDVALKVLDSLYQEFPDYDKRPYCLFLQGFIYENNLNELNKAQQKYQTFLKKYPDHKLRDDVKFSLKNLGRSPKAIIDSLENKKEQSKAPVDSSGSAS